jgi:flavin-dependent dehydrogenase
LKIAVVGAGVAGSYLMNRLPKEHHVECFEARPKEKWYTVCAWGTSAPYISEMVKEAGFSFEDYILHKGGRMIVDTGATEFEIKLKGLVTYDKHRLVEDMLNGKKMNWGSRINSVNELSKDFDVVIDATGLHRALLPRIENDVVIPSVEYQVKSREFPWDDFYIKPYRGLCVSGDTLVMANPEAKPISEVVTDEPVLTRNGWSPVKTIYKREYTGEIIEIIPFLCGFPVGLTPEHLVWVWDRKTARAGWKMAKDVRECHSKSVGDYVSVPIPTYPDQIVIRISDYVDGTMKEGKIYPTGRNEYDYSFGYQRPLDNELPVTDELCEFFGYYISEGNAFHNGIIVSNTNRTRLRRMRKLADHLFGIRTDEYVKGQIQLNSTILRRLFIALFGEGAPNKRIPQIAMGFPHSAKVALIRGLFIGDGGKERRLKYDHLSCTTRSQSLAFGLWQLLLNVGVVGSVSYSRSNQSYRIRVFGNQLRTLGNVFGPLELPCSAKVSRKYFIEDRMLYFAVRKVKKRKMCKGFVYDLETNGSFTTSFLVHNSGYFWFFPLGNGLGHIGAGDYYGKYKGELEAFLKKYNCEVIRKIGRPVRIIPPLYCQPFAWGKAIGVGESIGTVYPLLGEGIIPSMQCVESFVKNFPDIEAYKKEVLERFDIYTKVFKFIKSKLDGNFSLLEQLPNLLSIFMHMKKNERRYGLQTRLMDIFKVIRV